MPGSQTLVYEDYSTGPMREFEVKTRPSSLWRFVPGLGPLVIFRLGNVVSFRMEVRLQSGEVTKDEGDTMDVRLLIGGELIRAEHLIYGFPRKGQKISMEPEFFLNGLGHSQLRIMATPAYTFHVWEPVYSIVNWGMVLLAGALGGLVGFLLGKD